MISTTVRFLVNSHTPQRENAELVEANKQLHAHGLECCYQHGIIVVSRKGSPSSHPAIVAELWDLAGVERLLQAKQASKTKQAKRI